MLHRPCYERRWCCLQESRGASGRIAVSGVANEGPGAHTGVEITKDEALK